MTPRLLRRCFDFQAPPMNCSSTEQLSGETRVLVFTARHDTPPTRLGFLSRLESAGPDEGPRRLEEVFWRRSLFLGGIWDSPTPPSCVSPKRVPPAYYQRTESAEGPPPLFVLRGPVIQVRPGWKFIGSPPSIPSTSDVMKLFRASAFRTDLRPSQPATYNSSSPPSNTGRAVLRFFLRHDPRRRFHSSPPCCRFQGLPYHYHMSSSLFRVFFKSCVLA